MESITAPALSASLPPTRFVFVGEQCSRRAIQTGVCLGHGHPCARTLHAALWAIGLDPGSEPPVE